MIETHYRLPYPLLILAVCALLLLPAHRAHAGCQINIYVKNTGSARLKVYNKWAHLPSDESSVKIKMGTWRGLYTGGWWPGYTPGSTPSERFELDPGQQDGDNYRATFNCGAKRRYKIPYSCTEGKYANRSFTKYYPSETGWTDKQSVTIQLSRCK